MSRRPDIAERHVSPSTDIRASPGPGFRIRAADARPSWWVQLVLALACAAAAFLVRLTLDPWLGPRQPNTTAYGAITVAGWFAGWRAGALCAFVCYGWSLYFFTDPRHTFQASPDDLVAAATFFAVVALVLALTHKASTGSREQGIMVKRLQAEGDRRSALLATLAHELRSPLDAIKSAAAVLEAKGASVEAAQKIQRLLRRQVDFMSRLADDLTDAVRIHEGKISLQTERVMLDDLLSAALESIEPALGRKNQTCRIDTPGHAVAVAADPVRFNQILSNLLYNASKFSPEGSVIELAARVEGDALDIRVSDSGVGVPAERLDWIFDDFTQIREGGEGMGLGLALVRRLVELHGGSIKALSRGAGEGTTFELRFPGLVASR